MIRLYRPNLASWGNRHPVEDELNRLSAEGWWLVAVVSPTDYVGPTFVLQMSVPPTLRDVP